MEDSGSRSRIEQRLETVVSDVTTLKTDVAELKRNVAELATDVAGLKTDVAGLKVDVAELKTDVGVLKVDVAGLKTDMDLVLREVVRSGDELRNLNKYVRLIADDHEGRIRDLEEWRKPSRPV